MTPEQAIKKAQDGELLPVWLLAGEERFVRDQAEEAILKAALAGGLVEFNLDKFVAGEADVDRILGATRTVPMMAKKRVVLVRSVDRWDSGNADASSEEGRALPPLDKIAEYAKAPIDSTCLVLVGQKIDGRRKLMTMAKKQGFLVDCAPLEARAVPAWISARAKGKGHTIERHIAELIAEIAGSDLSVLDDALERLSLYVGEGNPITEEAVSVSVTRVKFADTWQLVAAASTKDLGRVLALFSDAFDPRDHGLPMVGALAWSVRQLLKLQVALGEGMSLDAAASRANIYPAFRAREYAEKLKGFRPRELERWLIVIQEADLALKSSRRPPDSILEEMFTRLCKRAA